MMKVELSKQVVFTQWLELMGRAAQLPFSLAITKCFIDVLHLTPTAFTIRLPSALFGILTVLGMYMLGRAVLFVGRHTRLRQGYGGQGMAAWDSLHAMKAYRAWRHGIAFML